MSRHSIALVAAALVAVATPAAAQGVRSRVEVSLFPNSHLIAARGDTAAQPRFKTYTPGGSVTVRLTRRFAIEGDVAGSRGNVQKLGIFGETKSPAILGAGVSLIAGILPDQQVQPYVAAASARRGCSSVRRWA